MISADIPKDLSHVKQKVVFNLTQRQILCFGGGALVGVPLYFILAKTGGVFYNQGKR